MGVLRELSQIAALATTAAAPTSAVRIEDGVEVEVVGHAEIVTRAATAVEFSVDRRGIEAIAKNSRGLFGGASVISCRISRPPLLPTAASSPTPAAPTSGSAAARTIAPAAVARGRTSVSGRRTRRAAAMPAARAPAATARSPAPGMPAPAVTAGSRRVARRRPATHETGLFVVERREGRRWVARTTRQTLRGAQDCAWDLLTKEGGEVRVRQGRSIVARGAGVEPIAR